VAEVGTLIGMSERSARDWIKRHELPVSDSRPLRVEEAAVLARLAREHRQPRSSPEAIGEVPGGTPEDPGGTSEPIEAAYRVAGEAVAEVALVPLATMVEELRGLANQLQEMSRRNEALALEVGQLRERQVGQAERLAAKDETIAELRRRAEAAEAELVRRRETEVSADALHQRRIDQERQNQAGMAEPSQEAPGSVWARLGRWWRG
jgi:regulator of replication initiation timing